MSTAEATELTDVLNRVNAWPTTLRITLCAKSLSLLIRRKGPAARPPRRYAGYRRRKSRACSRRTGPRPDDETVKQWIDEHRMEKYG